MESSALVLVVADETAATPVLLEALRERAVRGPALFHVLVPNPAIAGWRPSESRCPDVSEGERMLALALPRIEEATHSPVYGSVSKRHDPMDAIEEALLRTDFDEIVLSTVPHPVAHWLHVDLPRRVAHIGLPVTTVMQHKSAKSKGAAPTRPSAGHGMLRPRAHRSVRSA
jgi:hypothetical protein